VIWPCSVLNPFYKHCEHNLLLLENCVILKQNLLQQGNSHNCAPMFKFLPALPHGATAEYQILYHGFSAFQCTHLYNFLNNTESREVCLTFLEVMSNMLHDHIRMAIGNADFNYKSCNCCWLSVQYMCKLQYTSFFSFNYWQLCIKPGSSQFPALDVASLCFCACDLSCTLNKLCSLAHTLTYLITCCHAIFHLTVSTFNWSVLHNLNLHIGSQFLLWQITNK